MLFKRSWICNKRNLTHRRYVLRRYRNEQGDGNHHGRVLCFDCSYFTNMKWLLQIRPKFIFFMKMTAEIQVVNKPSRLSFLSSWISVERQRLLFLMATTLSLLLHHSNKYNYSRLSRIPTITNSRRQMCCPYSLINNWFLYRGKLNRWNQYYCFVRML